MNRVGSAVLAIAWLSATLIAEPADAAPPEQVGATAAPKMATDQSLAEAVVVEPGMTCLDHATLLGDLGSWRDTLRIDPRVLVEVRGSVDESQVIEFVVTVDGAIMAERRFDPAPSDCADLHAVVALAIAIALDDSLAAQLGIVGVVEPALAPVDQVEPGVADLPADDDSDRAPSQRPGPAMAVGVSAGVFAGPTPRLSAGGLLTFEVRPLAHFDIRVTGLATHLPSFALGSGEAAVTLAAGRVDLCWGTKPIAVRLRVCGGAAAGAMVSRGRGFTNNFQTTTPWFAAAVGVDVGVHVVGPLALELRVDGIVPLQRTRLDVRSEAGQLLASEQLPVAGVLVAVGPRFLF